MLKDIPQMLEETIKFFVERDGHGYRRFSLASQNMLSKYQWPGNLKQLLDLVQALLSRKDKEIINIDEVQEIITLQGPGGNILMENNILSLSMKEAKKLFERAYLIRQMELVGGKISELSRRVDMERTMEALILRMGFITAIFDFHLSLSQHKLKHWVLV